MRSAPSATACRHDSHARPRRPAPRHADRSGFGLGRGKPVDRFTAQSLGRLFGEPFGSAQVEGEAYGNVLASTAFLQGLRADDLRRDELDHRDQRCQMLVAGRAVKAG